MCRSVFYLPGLTKALSWQSFQSHWLNANQKIFKFWLLALFTYVWCCQLLILQVIVPLLVTEDEKTLVTCINCLTKVLHFYLFDSYEVLGCLWLFIAHIRVWFRRIILVVVPLDTFLSIQRSTICQRKEWSVLFQQLLSCWASFFSSSACRPAFTRWTNGSITIISACTVWSVWKPECWCSQGECHYLSFPCSALARFIHMKNVTNDQNLKVLRMSFLDYTPLPLLIPPMFLVPLMWLSIFANCESVSENKISLFLWNWNFSSKASLENRLLPIVWMLSIPP